MRITRLLQLTVLLIGFGDCDFFTGPDDKLPPLTSLPRQLSNAEQEVIRAA